MNLEIQNTLLEANIEMPSTDEILRRFRSDFASRLGVRLAGGISHVHESVDDDALASEGRFGGSATLEVRSAEAAVVVPLATSFSGPQDAPEAADVSEPYPEPEAAERTTAGLFADTEPSQELDVQPASTLLDEALREESLSQPADADGSDWPAPDDELPEPAPAAEEGRKGKKKKKRR